MLFLVVYLSSLELRPHHTLCMHRARAGSCHHTQHAAVACAPAIWPSDCFLRRGGLVLMHVSRELGRCPRNPYLPNYAPASLPATTAVDPQVKVKCMMP